MPLITQSAHTDTLGDPVKGFAAAPGLLLSIVSRAPAHAPWANAGQGVDVKVSTSASAILPAAPKSQVATAIASAATSPANTTTPAISSTVPAAPAASEALNKTVTSAMISGAAVNAAVVSPNITKIGSSIGTDATGQLNAVVGSLGMTPQQMETAGILKPGAASLVTGLVQGGANVNSAMTTNLFTGVPGAQNLADFTKNIVAQTNAQVLNFQSAQASLTQAGIITGKESPTAIAGLVNAVSQVGLKSTVDYVKNSTPTNFGRG